MTTARAVAMWSGIILLALGVLGVLFKSGDTLFGIFPMSVWLAILYVVTGTVLCFASSSNALTHSVSMWMALVFGAMGVIALFVQNFNLFGAFPVQGINVGLFLVFGAIMVYDWMSTPASRKMN